MPDHGRVDRHCEPSGLGEKQGPNGGAIYHQPSGGRRWAGFDLGIGKLLSRAAALELAIRAQFSGTGSEGEMSSPSQLTAPSV